MGEGGFFNEVNLLVTYVNINRNRFNPKTFPREPDTDS